VSRTRPTKKWSISPSIEQLRSLLSSGRRYEAPELSRAHSAHCARENRHYRDCAWRFGVRNISFVVAEKDMRTALAAAHREFRLGTLTSQALAEEKLHRSEPLSRLRI
jgi:hypothetical protein